MRADGSIAVVSCAHKSRLEVKTDKWRFVVHVSGGPPEVELSVSEIKLLYQDPSSGDAQCVLLPVPAEAQPLDLESAKCSFSRKRCELFIEWLHIKGSDVTSTEAETTASESEAEGNVASESVTESQPDDIIFDTTVDADDSLTAAVTEECEATLVNDAIVTGEEWKKMGNQAVGSGNFDEAIRCYSAGLAAGDGDEALLCSNRAHCYIQVGRNAEGFDDAKRCVALRPDFFKGYVRGAKALRALGRFEDALAFLKRCPNNDEAAALAAELRPEAESAEAARVASLDGCERTKEEGNVLYRKGLFEAAATKYSEALEACEDQQSSLALALRNNRAACLHQLSDHHSVLSDTSYVLQRDPCNIKALTRRMLALEPLERYEAALQDARTLLRQDPRNEAANKVQHRLSKLVRDLQRNSGAS